MNRHARTWLSGTADRVAEAGWLVALVMVPLFFNIQSSRVFEPEKVAALRLIALLLAFALIAKAIDAALSGSGVRALIAQVWLRLKTTPVLLLALLYVASYAFSTALSVVPHESLWGSYQRVHGLVSAAAAVLLFLALLVVLRTREQVERLITTALGVSFAVALYGIIQHFGQDPVPWSGDVVMRVASSLGNPIFAGAFLIMTVPLSLYRLLASGEVAASAEAAVTRWILVMGGLISLAFQMVAWSVAPLAGTVSAAITVGAWVAVAVVLRAPAVPLLRISVYTVVLAAQLMCVLFSQSRGPWLGLAAGLLFFSLAWTLTYRRWKLALLTVGLASVLFSGIVAMNVAPSGREFVQRSPYLERASRLLDAEQSTGRVRILIWEGSAALIAANPARMVAGYGPESMRFVYPPFYLPELGRVEDVHAMPDRAHNETFDAMISTGLPGLILYLLIFVSLFYKGTKALGLVQSRSERSAFAALLGGGGVGALVAVLLVDQSLRFAGVALPAGIALGLLIYLAGYGVHRLRTSDPASSGSDARSLLVIALLAAILGHFVEIQFGIAIVATRTYFWIFAAVLVLAGSAMLPPSGSSGPSPGASEGAALRPSRRKWRLGPLWPDAAGPLRRTLPGALIVGFVVALLAHNFIGLQDPQTHALGVLWLLAFTWIFGGMAVLVETGALRIAPRAAYAFSLHVLAFSVISLTIAACFFVLRRSGIGDIGGVASVVIVPYVFMFLLVGLLAYGLPGSDEEPRIPALPAFATLCLLVTIPAAAIPIFVRGIGADVHYRDAQQGYRGAPDHDEAIESALRALRLEPRQDQYHALLGEIYMHQAVNSDAPESREELFRRAEDVLIEARRINPLTVDHVANLARLNQVRAQASEPGSDGREHLERALSFYDLATAMSPRTPYLWNERGGVQALMGEEDAALESYRQSASLDGQYYETYVRIGNLHFSRERWEEAASAYAAALERNPRAAEAQLSLEIVRALQAQPVESGE